MRRILALLLAMIMIFALAACSNNTITDTDGEATASAKDTEITENNQATAEITSATIGTEEITTVAGVTQKPTNGTKPTKKPTVQTKPTEKPTEGSKPTKSSKSTEGTQPTESTQPTTLPTTGNDYKCSCGFTCTECSINNGLCAHYTDHYKDHPDACPHYYNGNPQDNWSIRYNPTDTGHQKQCNMCNTVWPEEAHTLVINKDKSIAGDCYTSKLTVSECTKCNYSIQDYSEGRQHNYGEWVYLTEPCGILPHYERYCTKCTAYDYRITEEFVTEVPCQGGTATCVDKAICKWCKKPYGSVSTTNHIGATEIRNAKSATCCKGYSGDTYCSACNKICSQGYDTEPIRDHSWQTIATGMYQCSECGTVEIRVGS